MWVLISLCNSVKRSSLYAKHGLSQIAALNLDTSEIYFLRIPEEINPPGFTGEAQDDKHIYVATQGKKQTKILRIKKANLKVELLRRTKQVKDAHSMVIFRKKLFIVSSGTNSIEMFDPKSLKYLGRYWQYPNTTLGDDQVHLNSICESSGELWVSAFGPKLKNKWSLTNKGHLINTADNSFYYRIYHPHSLIAYRGDLYYCESWTGTIYQNKKPIRQVPGSYTRGLDVNSRYIAVGLSSGRIRSKSSGALNAPREASRFNYFCGVLIIDKQTGREHYYALSKFSREIYEYTREIYAVKFVENITLNNLNNVVGHYKMSPSRTLESNPVISLLMDENQKLRLLLTETIADRNRCHQQLIASQEKSYKNEQDVFLNKIYTKLKDFFS